MGLGSMVGDLGLEMMLRLHTDSDACRGTCNRTGLGRLQHLQVEHLWIQEAVRNKRFDLVRINGALYFLIFHADFSQPPDVLLFFTTLFLPRADSKSAALAALGMHSLMSSMLTSPITSSAASRLSTITLPKQYSSLSVFGLHPFKIALLFL